MDSQAQVTIIVLYDLLTSDHLSSTAMSLLVAVHYCTVTCH